MHYKIWIVVEMCQLTTGKQGPK